MTPILLVFLPENLYNQFGMNAATLRLMLSLTLIAMYLLAMFSLRRRRLGLGAYLIWGLFALTIPALGPFIVIYTRPEKIYRTQTRAENAEDPR